MVEVPDGSIYLWMYTQGLKGTNINDIIEACRACGKEIRDKDFTNYFNGLHKHVVIDNTDIFSFKTSRSSTKSFFDIRYEDYPEHPFNWDVPEIQDRWVPCNKDNKPMIKWAKKCMTQDEAESMNDIQYLAENLCGTHMIVIDCDGDHGDGLDLETIDFLYQFSSMTHTLSKPKMCSDYGINIPRRFYDIPASFHLTFAVDHVIPTMHFPIAHIDIIGNKCNSLRYYKNKVSNDLPLLVMNDYIWEELKEFIANKEYKKAKRGDQC